jgi:Uncharacterised protein family (UPF0164)
MNLMNASRRSILFLLVYAVSVHGEDFSKAGTSAGQFLKIPVGAKAMSMASTSSSVADDISTLYWNPAGAASIDRFEIGVSHTSWLADIAHNYLAIALPMGDNGTVGFSVDQLNSGDIETTTIEAPKGTGTYYTAADIALSVTYARAIMDRVNIGVSAKYISQRIAGTSAQTVGFDLGFLLRTDFYGATMGIAFRNFGPALTMSGTELIKTVDLDPVSAINPVVEADLKTQAYALPASFHVSFSMPVVGPEGLIPSGSSSFVASVEGVHLSDNPEHFSVGAEYGFTKTFFLRGGYIFNTDEEGSTFGAGVNIPIGASVFTVDYAYASFGVFPAVHVFSLGIKM